MELICVAIKMFLSKNIEMMNYFINSNPSADDHTKWLMIRSLYKDPDEKSVKFLGGIACGADGLVSLRKLHDRYGIQPELVKEYKECRKTPIIHFPKERKGINMSRAAVFGDRIDHTLYDLKRFCEGYEDCKLKLAYSLPKTSQWLECFKYDFSELVKWMEIDNVFVKNNEVFDLEKNDGSFITEYRDTYERKWTDSYYNNLKSKILLYENSH